MTKEQWKGPDKGQTSFRLFRDFSGRAQQFLEKHPGFTRIGYNLGRVGSQFKVIFDDFSDQEEIIAIEKAAVGDDDKKQILRSAVGQYIYDVAGDKARALQIQGLHKDPAGVKFRPFWTRAEDIPNDITELELQTFEGFVITEDEAMRFREMKWAEADQATKAVDQLVNGKETEDAPI